MSLQDEVSKAFSQKQPTGSKKSARKRPAILKGVVTTAVLTVSAASLFGPTWGSAGDNPKSVKASLLPMPLVAKVTEEQDPTFEVVSRGNDAQESTRLARILKQKYVDSGGVTFSDAACWGTRQDFLDQVARPYTDRGPGRGTSIHPNIWVQAMVIAADQERRGASKPYVEFSCLARSHSISTTTGGISAHPAGLAADISVIGGFRIGVGSDLQHRNDKVTEAIRALWAARIYPRQLISLHTGRGGTGIDDIDNPTIYDACQYSQFPCGAFYMSNHANHLHLSVPDGS